MDFCVCCGEYVPEGMMVCTACRMKYMGREQIEKEKEEERKRRREVFRNLQV